MYICLCIFVSKFLFDSVNINRVKNEYMQELDINELLVKFKISKKIFIPQSHNFSVLSYLHVS